MFMGGRGTPDRALKDPQTVRWNIQVMLEALDCCETEVREIVVTNLLYGEQSLEVVPVFRKALTDRDSSLRKLASDALGRVGYRLVGLDTECLEAAVITDPNDVALRIVLLGYYFRKPFCDESVMAKCNKHILWIIEKAPDSAIAGLPYPHLSPDEDGEAYDQAKHLWLRHVETNGANTAILANAAHFFRRAEPDTSEHLLKKAQSLEPTNPEWSKRLAHLYKSGSWHRSRKARREAAARSLAELENALKNTTDVLGRCYLLADLARAAFEAEDLEKAQAYASELLTMAAQPDYANDAGDAVHHGNLVLGRLALRSGNLEQAKSHLIEAAKTTGSRPLMSFGPNMMLAKELLEHGERDAVIQYLRLCTNFWYDPYHQPQQWIHAIEQGAIPDFGANLDY
jgi:hypothetical protein